MKIVTLIEEKYNHLKLKVTQKISILGSYLRIRHLFIQFPAFLKILYYKNVFQKKNMKGYYTRNNTFKNII